jgi:hypothetical protein
LSANPKRKNAAPPASNRKNGVEERTPSPPQFSLPSTYFDYAQYKSLGASRSGQADWTGWKENKLKAVAL